MYEVFQEYSSPEVFQVAEMARVKGLTLLEEVFGGGNGSENKDDVYKGYCVVKEIVGQTLTLKDDGTVFQDYAWNCEGTNLYKTVDCNLTLEQARTRIANFNGYIKNYPRFFAFARVYENEPDYFGTVQQICLDEFAYRHGITYAGKFICSGGLEDDPCDGWGGAAVDDVIACCEASFSDITKDDYLVVADYSRLNSNFDVWDGNYEIICVGCEDKNYSRYNRQYKYYHYSETIRVWKEALAYEKWKEENEYEEICYEYQKMMSEMDIPDVPAIEWDEEDEEPCIVPEEQDE